MATKDINNNTETVHLDRKEFERVKIIIEQIAPLADLAATMTLNGMEQASNDYDEAARFCASAKELINKIGWLADTATGKLDGMPYKDAEDWLLPPSYQWIGQEQEAQP